MPTAYEDGLARLKADIESATQDPEDDFQFGVSTYVPKYGVQAESHGMASNSGLFEGLVAFAQGVPDAIAHTPHFVVSSLTSGVAQLYNSGAELANWAGADLEHIETEEVLRGIDDDVASWYAEHQEAADLTGFIAGSIVPGALGVKGVRMFQGSAAVKAALAGKHGKGMQTAMKVLAPERQKHLAGAIKEAISTDTVFKVTERNMLKAMGAGFGQSVIEVAAAETMTYAMMHQSPILEGQDFGDFISNVAFTSVAFGAIGGAVSGATDFYKVKKATTKANFEAMPWTHKNAYPNASAEAQVSLALKQINDIPAITDDVVATIDDLDTAVARKGYLTSKAASKIESLHNDMRAGLLQIADGNSVQAEAMFNSIISTNGYAGKVGKSIGLQEAVGVTVPTKVEMRLEALGAKLQKGKATLEELEEFEKLNVGYQRNWGFDDGAPQLSDLPPVVTQLADTADRVEVNPKTWTVTAGDKKYSVSRKLDDFQLLRSSPLEVNARHIVAQSTDPFVSWKATAKKPITIRDDDIPFLEKLLREFEETVDTVPVQIKDAGGELYSFSKYNRESYEKWLVNRKVEVARQLIEESSKGNFSSVLEHTADRLRAITGVPFVVATPKSINAHGMHQFIGKALAESNALANKALDLGATQQGFRRISINANDLTSRPMQDLVQTLKHEEGHDIFTSILQNGGIPADKTAAIISEMESISRKIRTDKWELYDALQATKKSRPLTTAELDHMAYMESQHELAADTFSYFSQWYKQGKEVAPEFEKTFGGLVRQIPEEVVAEYASRANKLQEQEIAAMVNTTVDYLNGGIAAADDGAFAMQTAAAKYSQKLRDNKILRENAPDVAIWKVPQHTKVAYDTSKISDADNFVTSAMTYYKEQAKLYMTGVRTATSGVLGEFAQNLPEALVIDTRAANNFGAGAGFASFANGNYGSLASAAEFMGRYTTKIKSAFRDRTFEALNPALVRLKSNRAAAIEFSTLNAKLRSIPENYMIHPEKQAFVHAATYRWQKKVAEAQEVVKRVSASGDEAAIAKATKELEKAQASKPVVATLDAPLEIPVKDPITMQAAKIHVERNGTRVGHYANIRQAQGVNYNRDPEVFYPVPVNTKDYPYFAIVSDETVTAGWGNTSTLYATSADELERLTAAAKAANPKIQVRTGADAEKYYKSLGIYDAEKSLTDNYFDISMKRKGVSAPFAPPTDPAKITDDLLNWHLEKESGLVNETMLAHYEDKFEELRMLGETHTNFQTSKFSNVRKLKHIEDAVTDNPYLDYIKTALGLPNNSNYPLWSNANRWIDEAVSRLGRSISSNTYRAKSPEELEAIGQALEDAGYPGARYSADMELFVNNTAPRGLLESFVRKANSILSTITLRLDAIQAVNNAVSSNVLVGAEVKAVMRAIEAGDSYAVGKLTAIAKTKIPGTPHAVTSPSKLIANSYRRYYEMLAGDDSAKALRQFYKDNGFITSISEQYKWSLDQLSFTGKESVKQMEGAVTSVHDRLVAAADIGEKWTGNALAEEMNRFVSADVMKQLTDIAVEAGKMSRNEALSYINTFVSRTQGNYLAAQRPALFKGAIGQSIGLFQTYQFNLIQQLLRHVGEGQAKDAMTLLALQGSIHGMHGLPAFSAINQHLVGTASGNTNHRDLYDATYSAAGKEAGDWLLYGAGSNFLGLLHPDLKFNLYSRGDLNPRHLTVIPTSIDAVPWVSAYGKFLGNFIETGKKMMMGGDPTQTLLQGIEHNGLSRPLAGIAQSLEAATNPRMLAYSTTKQGNISASNDFFSLATAVRIAGAKPLDDAIALDTVYRLQAYGLRDSKKLRLLGESFKTRMIGGEVPDREALLGTMQKYMEYGGTQEKFSVWARQLYKSANLSQANKFAEDLESWEGQHMQKIMAGEIPDDFHEVTPK